MSSMVKFAITTSICEKWSTWFFSKWLIMGRSINWPELVSSIYKIQDKQVICAYWPTAFCNFQSARSSTLSLTWSQSCKEVMWGRATKIGVVTWPSEVLDYYLHIMCKKDEGIVRELTGTRLAHDCRAAIWRPRRDDGSLLTSLYVRGHWRPEAWQAAGCENTPINRTLIPSEMRVIQSRQPAPTTASCCWDGIALRPLAPILPT